jgi:cytochrome c oxidase assembly protein subunit 15
MARYYPVTGIRRTALLALGLAYIHTVFGAIVRISGSGLGCGEHWPDCNGAFLPVIGNYTVAIEITHRFLAGTLLGVTVALLIILVLRRGEPWIGGPGGVLRPVVLAVALIVTAALVGMLVVMGSLQSPYLIAVHYSIAMALLGVLVVAAERAGAFGYLPTEGSPRAYRGAAAAAALAFITVVLGALTANGAPGAYIQPAHRGLAVLLGLHLIGLSIGIRRRHEPQPIVTASSVAVGLVLLQIALGITLLALHLPPVLQSIHQATGTLLWIVVFTLAVLAREASRLMPTPSGPRPEPVPGG